MSRSEDSENQYVYTYEYDSLGRLIRGTVDDLTTAGILMSCENKYDSLGRPSTSTYVVEGRTISYYYTYLPNSTLIEGMSITCNGTTVEVVYFCDDLERVRNKSVCFGETCKMIKLSQEKVLLLHKLITEETGGDPNVRDMALLNSASESVF